MGVPTVADLLASQQRLGVSLLAGPAVGRPIRDVTSIEALSAIAEARAGSLLVVMQQVATHAAGYELDIALRRASERRLSALVLVGRTELPVTARNLAGRAGLPVLGAAPGSDIADLVLRIDRVIRGGAAETLARVEAAIVAIGQAQQASRPMIELLAAASTAVGLHADFVEDETFGASRHLAGAVMLRGQVVGRVRFAPVDPAGSPTSEGEHPDDAVGLLLPILAAAVGQRLEDELSHRHAPAQSRAELLTALLVAERAQLPPLLARARELGFPTELAHIAVWVQVNTDARTMDSEELVRQRRLLDLLEVAALQLLPTRRSHWNVARPPAALVLISSDATAKADAGQQVRAQVQAVLASLPADRRQQLSVGIGTPQLGVDGLRHSSHEARTAAESARRGSIAAFDATGLRRLLAELDSSALSRRMMGAMLDPIDALPPGRARQAVQTLAAYLDAQCSPTAAAKALSLHPNAVSYRIKHLVELLGVDLADPDARLILHLACRARLTAR